jgi:hypothetical protein
LITTQGKIVRQDKQDAYKMFSLFILIFPGFWPSPRRREYLRNTYKITSRFSPHPRPLSYKERGEAPSPFGRGLG